MSYRPPDDLDKLAAAWARLQAMTNTTLPAMTARADLVRARIGTTTYPPPKRPS